ncbi:DUF6163 family protein [Chelativorans sp. Marseille-P2723]|uniref:DUF6163 family protein n=1 Tax=Chelativorans sp. Marseille-P2723 TaxID=2709133 RepID=UPI0032B1EE2B
MEETAARLPVRQTPLEHGLQVFQRVVALACLAFGTAYWVQLLGFFEGAHWRVDLMPFHWQMAAVPLAVLFPFAAVGLWLLASWGAVVWFLCVAMEFAMYGFFPDLYGSRPLLLVLHMAAFGCFAVMRGMLYLRQRRAD